MFKIDKNYIFLLFIESGCHLIFSIVMLILIFININTTTFSFFISIFYVATLIFESLFGFWVIYINYQNFGKEFNNQDEHTNWIKTFLVYRLKRNLGYLYFTSTLVGSVVYIPTGYFINITPKTLSVAVNCMIFISLLKFFALVIMGIFIAIHHFIDKYRSRNAIRVPSPPIQNNNQEKIPPIFIPKIKDYVDSNCITEECSICLDIDVEVSVDGVVDPNINYNDKKWGITQCGHKFHKKCILQWFNVKETCPICRIVLEKETDENISIIDFL